MGQNYLDVEVKVLRYRPFTQRYLKYQLYSINSVIHRQFPLEKKKLSYHL